MSKKSENIYPEDKLKQRNELSEKIFIKLGENNEKLRFIEQNKRLLFVQDTRVLIKSYCKDIIRLCKEIETNEYVIEELQQQIADL